MVVVMGGDWQGRRRRVLGTNVPELLTNHLPNSGIHICPPLSTRYRYTWLDFQGSVDTQRLPGRSNLAQNQPTQTRTHHRPKDRRYTPNDFLVPARENRAVVAFFIDRMSQVDKKEVFSLVPEVLEAVNRKRETPRQHYARL